MATGGMPTGAHLGPHISGVDAGPLLSDLLRRCDVEDALRLVATVAAEQAAGNDAGGATLPGHRLALVARSLLERESERDGRTGPLSRRELELCCELAGSVASSPDRAFGVQVSDSAWSMMHRVAYQQLPDVEEQGYVLRSLALYRQIAPRQQESAGFGFEEAFEQASVVTLDRVWAIGRSLWKWCLEHPGESFDSAGLARCIGVDGIGVGEVESFLGIMACDYSTFRSMLGVPSGRRPHFEPYNLNPLRKHPILKLPDGDYLTPIPSFLLRRITHGLYYDLIELDRAGFVRLVARSFAAYVERLLTGQKNVAQLYGDGWWVDGAVALVIECVTRPFGALSRSTGDRDHLRADLARPGGVVDRVKRVRGFLDADGNSSPGQSALHAKRVIGLVVALEDFYLANGPFVRGIVNEELEAQGEPPMDGDVQLAHVGGLEALSALSARSGVPLTELLAEKVDGADYRDLELDAYARYRAAMLPSGQDPSLRPKVLEDVSAAFLGP